MTLINTTPQQSPQAPQQHALTPDCVTVAENLLTVFVESKPMIDAMVKDIRSAKRRVWLEVYIFEFDDAGRPLAEALKERAAAGVDVRLLYDAVGSAITPAAVFTDLHHAGAKVHAYHTLWDGLRNFRPVTILNRRDHRKLLIVDDEVAYFGGMNIVDTGKVHRQGDEATNVQLGSGVSRPSRPSLESAGWRDVHVRLQGPAAPEVAESFDRSWRAAYGEKLTRRPRSYRRAMLPPYEESIAFFDSGPFLKNSRAARVYTRLILRAQHSITLSMAYFIPVGRVLNALLAQRRRGRRIRVVLPGQSDVPLVQRATCHLYTQLLKRGFRIYERQKQMLHSKVMVIDDEWTVVGSCNVDPRSLWINLEFLAVVRSRPFAELIGRVCAYEIQHSRRVQSNWCESLPWRERFLNRLAWAVRWWL